MPRPALESIRVIDLTLVWAGPLTTRVLADLGAEVIKIEACQRPDRGRVGIFADNERGERHWNRAGLFNALNRNKYGITLDLAHPKGAEIFKGLVRISDVVVENYSPRVMRNFGLDYPVLSKVKPDLIMASLSGYGQTGPYWRYGAYGFGIDGMSGQMGLTGYMGGPVLGQATAHGDPVGAMSALVAILSALHYRNQTDQGQYIDLASREALMNCLPEAIMDYTMNQRMPARAGNRDIGVAPHGCYRCHGNDAWIAISVASEEEWHRFCKAIGDPAWTRERRFADMKSRLESQDELDELIELWTTQHDHRKAMSILQEGGVAAGAVLRVDELLADPHLKQRGFAATTTHPEVGTRVAPGVWIKLSKNPGRIIKPAPCLGQDNEFILHHKLGLSKDETDDLARQQVIGTVPMG